MPISPIPPQFQPSQPRDDNPNWTNVMHYLSMYVNMPPGDIMDAQSFEKVLNGLELFIRKAGSATQTAFQKLQADFQNYCHNPSMGAQALQNDVRNLATHPATLTNIDLKQATNELISKMYDTVGDGDDIGELQNILMAMCCNSNQLPRAFSGFLGGDRDFHNALNAYIESRNPTQSQIEAAQNGLMRLQATLFS